MQIRMVIMGLLLLPVTAFAVVEVNASVDANRIAPNETVTFKIESSGGDDFPVLDISPILNNFTVVSGPGQQTSFQWINGKMSSTRSLTWTLLPKKAGRLTIPALEIRVGRKLFQSKPIVIQVGKAGVADQTASAGADVFIIAEPDKKQVYLGEQVTVTYKLYTRASLRGIEYIERPKMVGFWVEDLFSPTQPPFRAVTIKGVNYKVATLYKAALFPTKVGTINISPMKVRCQVEIRNSRRSRRSLFDDFFSDPFATQTVPKIISTDPVAITVKSLPAGQPQNFTGAVGEFKLTAGSDRKNVNTNEAIAYKITLSGTGNLKLFELLELDFPEDMEVFPPTSSYEKDPFRDAISGTMTREYILIPRTPGKFTLPQASLSFFNPKDRKWHQLRSKPLSVTVNSRPPITADRSDLTKAEIALLGKDIRYIKTSLPDWYLTGRRSVSFGIFFIYLLALVLFSGPWLYTNLLAYSQTSNSNRRAGQALKVALKSLNATSEDKYAQAAKVIYQYLQSKLRLKTDKLDPKNAQSLISGRVSRAVADHLNKILTTCDAGRYAPATDDVVSSLIYETRELLSRLDAEL